MEKFCATCVHFRQHYTKTITGFRKTPSGHCTEPRVKLRKEKTPACRRYRERAPSAEKAALSGENAVL